MKSIDNITIVHSGSDGVSLSWIWPAEIKCVRVVFLHKLSDTAPEKLSFDELNRVSDLCFLNEFRSNNNMYIYKPRADDNGRLAFMVYASSDDGQTLYSDFHSEAISDTSHSSTIMTHIKYEKDGKNYRIGYLIVDSEVDVPAGIIEYEVGGVRYPMGELLKGHNQIGPIIVGISQGISFGVSLQHSGEFVLKSN